MRAAANSFDGYGSSSAAVRGNLRGLMKMCTCTGSGFGSLTFFRNLGHCMHLQLVSTESEKIEQHREVATNGEIERELERERGRDWDFSQTGSQAID